MAQVVPGLLSDLQLRGSTPSQTQHAWKIDETLRFNKVEKILWMKFHSMTMIWGRQWSCIIDTTSNGGMMTISKSFDDNKWGVIKKLKLNKLYLKKKKKNTHTKIHEILQFFYTSFHILKSSHDSLLSIVIIYCQCRCDHFILLSLYNIFIFMLLSLFICYCFL